MRGRRVAFLIVFLAPVAGAQERDGGPWLAEVKGWKAPEAGEHPR